MSEAVKEVKQETVFTEEALGKKVAAGEQLTDPEKEFLKGNPKSVEEETPGEEVKAGEETPASEKPGEEKSKETPAPKPNPEERRQVIERELEKPDNQQDLSKFSEAEVGLFIDLRKQREKNRRLTEENDRLRFEKLKTELKEAVTPPKVVVEEEDPLAGREDTDLLTVADVRRILTPKKTTKEEKGGKETPRGLITPEETRAQEITAEQTLKEKGITDFKDVTQHVSYALHDDPEAQEILRGIARNNLTAAPQDKVNIAEKIYWLVKGSKKWPTIKVLIEQERGKVAKPGEEVKKPAGELKQPPAENLERGERIKKNGEKVVTTGAGGGADEVAGEFTAKDIADMSTEDFGKLPRETRDKILKKFGSEPNMAR